ncbi:unnamed protein product [Echinostoma caproni]|uniref:methylated diphthine methylhydrolase n=1 Tax=Echinostoma caproni TaxID=27848 RepID=A0A183AAS5_9TREM|nr:unnamed protein product [Echinostoma caproni]
MLNCAGLLDLSWLDNYAVIGAQANGEAIVWHFHESYRTEISSSKYHVSDTLLLSTQVMHNKHDVGVCSVVAQPMAENVLSTGCYDGFLRLWDLRMPSERVPGRSDPVLLLCSTGGGGVWRQKWLADRYVLMAAMHTGFMIIGPLCSTQFGGNTVQIEPLACYRPSAKLAYGIDCFEQNSAGVTTDQQLRAVVATCSFYDNTVDFSQLLLPAVLRE